MKWKVYKIQKNEKNTPNYPTDLKDEKSLRRKDTREWGGTLIKNKGWKMRQRTLLKPQVRVWIRSSGSNTRLYINRPRCVSECVFWCRGHRIAWLLLRSLRGTCDTAGLMASSHQGSHLSPLPPKRAGVDHGNDTHCCWKVWRTPLLDRVVALPFASPSCRLPLISCPPVSASRSRRSERFWQPGRHFKTPLLCHFLPHITASLPAWLLLPGAVRTSANFEKHIIELLLFWRLLVGDGVNA